MPSGHVSIPEHAVILKFRPALDQYDTQYEYTYQLVFLEAVRYQGASAGMMYVCRVGLLRDVTVSITSGYRTMNSANRQRIYV